MANPNVEGRPRPVGFLTGFDHWQVIPQVGALIMVVVLTIVFIRGWRRNPGSPVLLMVLVTTLIVWQDPIMNWSPYAVYNPALLHWPESWPLIMMSPTVEPFIVFGYVTFYFGPYFPAIWILRKMQAKRGPEAFVCRHPLLSLGGLVLVIGFIFDAMLEISLVRTGLYIYSQAIPFGTLFAGSTFQFPLIWESLSVTFVMIPAAILVYRDDTGKSVAEKLAAKAKLLPDQAGTRHVPGDVRHHQRVVLRLRRAGSGRSRRVDWRRRSPARGRIPRPRCTTRRGITRRNGAEGPFSVGKWSTWQQGLPDGAPTSNRRCARTKCACSARAVRMAEPRSVVITGASRGLGLASAARLYQRGVARRRSDALARRGHRAAA